MPTDSLPDIDKIIMPLPKGSIAIYWTILILVTTGIAALPLIRMDVSVRATGIIRPLTERTEIRPVMSGIIETIHFAEGDYVQKDSVILLIKNNTTDPRINATLLEIRQRNDHIHDLRLLTKSRELTENTIPLLRSGLYRQQLHRFLYQLRDQGASLQKVSQEMKADSMLFSDQVISVREYMAKKTDSEKLMATSQAVRNEQLGAWEQQLATLSMESSQLQVQQKQLEDEKQLLSIRAPVSGRLQGMINRYAGGYIQAGEIFCELSPEAGVLAECFVESRDIGLVRPGQIVRFQVDAFDYNYFGTLTGHVTRIDNDFSMISNKPMFRVRCLLNSDSLVLKNGYTGTVKKGLTLRARFIVNRRSLLQLLFDNIDDWLSPARS